MPSFADGLALGRAILAAAGVDPDRPWQRVAVVVDCDAVPQIYVKGLLDHEASAGIVRAVQDVTVSAECDVEVLPFAVEV